jgi:hypothetical protein
MEPFSSSKLISCYLDNTNYPDLIPVRYINYRENKLPLSEEQYLELVERLPSYWNTDKDKLKYFVLNYDGSYYCERVKNVYNFATQQTEKKNYLFDNSSPEKVKELSEILIKYYEEQTILDIQKVNDSILESVRNLSLVKGIILSIRKEYLQESDYMFNVDYVFKDESVGEKWVKYRQEWRDVTEQESWKNNNLSDIKFPLRPENQKEQLDDLIAKFVYKYGFTTELENSLRVVNDTKEYVKRFMESVILQEVLSKINSLKIPQLDKAFRYNISSLDVSSKIDSFDDMIDLLKQYENNLNDVLSELNLDYTVGDLIKDTYAKMTEDDEVVAILEEIQETMEND